MLQTPAVRQSRRMLRPLLLFPISRYLRPCLPFRPLRLFLSSQYHLHRLYRPSPPLLRRQLRLFSLPLSNQIINRLRQLRQLCRQLLQHNSRLTTSKPL